MTDMVVEGKLKKCGPTNLDERVNPEIDPSVAASYPSDRPQYSYNHESPTHKVLIMFADGKHPDDRWNLSDDQIGAGTAHEHDDYKRNPPTILQDADPKDSRVGYMANFRLPDSAPVYTLVQGGDELGLSPEQRAKAKPKDLTDGIGGT